MFAVQDIPISHEWTAQSVRETVRTLQETAQSVRETVQTLHSSKRTRNSSKRTRNSSNSSTKQQKAVRNFEPTNIMGGTNISEGVQRFQVVSEIFVPGVRIFRGSKYSVTGLCVPGDTSTTLATVLVDQVISRFGVPNILHSDKGANLCSEVIKAVYCLLGMGKTIGHQATHPQGNGQVERFNRTVEAILAKTVIKTEVNQSKR